MRVNSRPRASCDAFRDNEVVPMAATTGVMSAPGKRGGARPPRACYMSLIGMGSGFGSAFGGSFMGIL